jgi:hypothetical protein
MAGRNTFLFQYGSNMEPERLNSSDRLAGAAQVVGVARLDHWGIRFDFFSANNECGVTDIVSAAREHVLGFWEFCIKFRTARWLHLEASAPRWTKSRVLVLVG